MRVGVFGGTRFIGYHLVERLHKIGATICIYHRGRTLEPRNFSGPVQRILGDRNDLSRLEQFFQKNYDAVIDLSGYRYEQVAPLLSRWRSKIGHFIFCSTTRVYQTPLAVPFDESSPLEKTMGTYGGEKAAIEEHLFHLSERYRWPVTVLRPQGVLGIFGAVQPLYVFRRILAKEPILIRPETIDRKINFLGVDDLAQCFIRAIGHPKAFGEAFNVAGDVVLIPKDLNSLLYDIMGRGQLTEVVLDPDLSDQLPRLGLPWMAYDMVASNEKVKDKLGVVFTPIEKLLQQIWDWCQQEPFILRLGRERWEKEALQGKMPPMWVKGFWCFFDALRGPLLKSRWGGTLRNFGKRLLREIPLISSHNNLI